MEESKSNFQKELLELLDLYCEIPGKITSEDIVRFIRGLHRIKDEPNLDNFKPGPYDKMFFEDNVVNQFIKGYYSQEREVKKHLVKLIDEKWEELKKKDKYREFVNTLFGVNLCPN